MEDGDGIENNFGMSQEEFSELFLRTLASDKEKRKTGFTVEQIEARLREILGISFLSCARILIGHDEVSALLEISEQAVISRLKDLKFFRQRGPKYYPIVNGLCGGDLNLIDLPVPDKKLIETANNQNSEGEGTTQESIELKKHHSDDYSDNSETEEEISPANPAQIVDKRNSEFEDDVLFALASDKSRATKGFTADEINSRFQKVLDLDLMGVGSKITGFDMGTHENVLDEMVKRNMLKKCEGQLYWPIVDNKTVSQIDRMLTMIQRINNTDNQQTPDYTNDQLGEIHKNMKEGTVMTPNIKLDEDFDVLRRDYCIAPRRFPIERPTDSSYVRPKRTTPFPKTPEGETIWYTKFDDRRSCPETTSQKKEREETEEEKRVRLRKEEEATMAYLQTLSLEEWENDAQWNVTYENRRRARENANQRNEMRANGEVLPDYAPSYVEYNPGQTRYNKIHPQRTGGPLSYYQQRRNYRDEYGAHAYGPTTSQQSSTQYSQSQSVYNNGQCSSQQSARNERNDYTTRTNVPSSTPPAWEDIVSQPQQPRQNSIGCIGDRRRPQSQINDQESSKNEQQKQTTIVENAAPQTSQTSRGIGNRRDQVQYDGDRPANHQNIYVNCVREAENEYFTFSHTRYPLIGHRYVEYLGNYYNQGYMDYRRERDEQILDRQRYNERNPNYDGFGNDYEIGNDYRNPPSQQPQQGVLRQRPSPQIVLARDVNIHGDDYRRPSSPVRPVENRNRELPPERNDDHLLRFGALQNTGPRQEIFVLEPFLSVAEIRDRIIRFMCVLVESNIPITDAAFTSHPFSSIPMNFDIFRFIDNYLKDRVIHRTVLGDDGLFVRRYFFRY